MNDIDLIKRIIKEQVIRCRNEDNATYQVAKERGNDEYYTGIEDIKKELLHYRKQFIGKSVYCCCCDHNWSNFWIYLRDNFELFGIRELVCTHLQNPRSTMVRMTAPNSIREIPLKGNGDFTSKECVELLKQSDVVVSNPPFSGGYPSKLIKMCMMYGKKFVMIAPRHINHYKDVFPYIKDNKMWVGHNKVKNFRTPNGDTRKFNNILWYTNMDKNTQPKDIPLTKSYNETDYDRIDNQDIIYINKLADIPYNYDGVMAVPDSIVDRLNHNQFEVLGMMNKPMVNGKARNSRYLVRRK